MTVQLQWFGTSCILLQDGITSLMIDPHFSRPGKMTLLRKLAPHPARVEQGLRIAGIEKLDGILLTHSHYDHALDACLTAEYTGARLFGSYSLRNLCDHSDQRIEIVDAQETYSTGDFHFRFLPSTHLPFPAGLNWLSGLDKEINQPLHFPARFWDYRAGQVYSIHLKHRNTSLIIQGSAGFIAKPDEWCHAGSAVLSIGGLGFQAKAYLERWFVKTVSAFGAKQLWLSHWEDFTRPFGEPPRPLPGTRRILQWLEERACGVKDLSLTMLRPGERYEW